MQIKQKLMQQTWENGKKLIFNPILACLTQIRALKIFFASFTSTSSWILFQAIILYNFMEK